MNFVCSVATINLNSTNTAANKSLLKEFINEHNIDIVFLQEVSYNDLSFVSSHNGLVNISVDRKGTAILIRKGFNYSDFIFDPSGRILSVVVNEVNYINIYAHSGSDKKRERDELFTEGLSVHLNKPGTAYTMLGGDFNCILEANDSLGLNKNFSNGLKNLVELFQFKDVAKSLKVHRFTFHRNQSASRLDRFYASKELIGNVISCRTLPVVFSDHHCVILTLKIRKEQIAPRGRGYWKINPSFLGCDETKHRFRAEVEKLRQRSLYGTDLSAWWNYSFKSKAKSFYKSESWHLNKSNRSSKATLSSKLFEYFDRQTEGEDVSDEISIIKSKLMDLEHSRLKNLSSKMSTNSIAEGEKVTIYHLCKGIHRENVFGLRLRNGDTLETDSSKVGSLVQDHFRTLYSGSTDEPNLDRYENPLNSIVNSLSVDDGDDLIQEISEDELLRTLNTCNKKKSPGPDGLTYEFYLSNFDILKDDLLRLFNMYLNGSSIPPKEFTDGIITLIPKKGDLTNLDNHRPISLLNTDYKLFTKIICNRMQKSVEKLVGPGQSACIPERSCIENLKDVRRIMTKAAESKRFKGLLLSLDLEKAFDKVDHNFLWKVLHKFGFPDKLIECIQRLYSKATSRVLYNGFLTQEIKIRSSVRQGCPLSMLLFVLYVEPLIRMIDQSVLGVLVYDKFLRVIAFADDVNIFLRNSEELDNVLNIIAIFSKFSKISLNLKKSKFLRINNCCGGPFQVTETENLRLLGITFKATWNDTVDCNYDKLIADMKHRIWQVSFRNMCLIERVWYINTFVLSKLWYLAQIYPAKNQHLAKIKTMIGNFIWKNCIFRVDRRQLYLDSDMGGLGLIDPTEKCKALFIWNIQKNNDQNCPLGEKYFLNYKYLSKLTRNGKEWITITPQLDRNLDSVKKLYRYFINLQGYAPLVQTLYPQVNWTSRWKIFSYNFLLAEDKSTLFLLLNDLIANKFKKEQYGIGSIGNVFCDECGNNFVDSNEHRIKACISSKEVRDWVCQVLKRRLKVQFRDLEDLLGWNVDLKCPRQRAASWLAVHCISFCIQKYPKTSLFMFQKSIREFRWNQKNKVKDVFGQYLNIC